MLHENKFGIYNYGWDLNLDLSSTGQILLAAELLELLVTEAENVHRPGWFPAQMSSFYM